MKTKRERASEKCRKKAGRSSAFDSEVWRPRIEEHTITPRSVAAGDQKCWWGTVIDRGSGVPHPPIKKFECNRFDFLYSGAFGGWPLPIYYSFRFIAYILTFRAWTSLHCIYRPSL
jgi:hypothetical protein